MKNLPPYCSSLPWCCISQRALCNFPTATAPKQVITQLVLLGSHGKHNSRWDTLVEIGLQKTTGIKSKLKFGSRHILKQGLVRWKDKAMSETESPGSCPPFIYVISRHTRRQRYTYKKAKPLLSLWLYASSQGMRYIYKKCTILSEIPHFLAFEPSCKVLIYGEKKWCYPKITNFCLLKQKMFSILGLQQEWEVY